jgi:hypothetical protein
MTRLKTFANQVMTYVRGIGEVTEQDRQALRDVWESTPLEEEVPYGYGVAASPASSDSNPYEREYERILGLGAGLYSMPARPPAKTNASGELAGITPRLIKVRVSPPRWQSSTCSSHISPSTRSWSHASRRSNLTSPTASRTR